MHTRKTFMVALVRSSDYHMNQECGDCFITQWFLRRVFDTYIYILYSENDIYSML